MTKVDFNTVISEVKFSYDNYGCVFGRVESLGVEMECNICLDEEDGDFYSNVFLKDKQENRLKDLMYNFKKNNLDINDAFTDADYNHFENLIHC